MADGLVNYAKARAFKTKTGQSQGQGREIWFQGQGLTSVGMIIMTFDRLTLLLHGSFLL